MSPHRRYDEFVSGVVALRKQYRLGSPLDPDTTIGPVVRTAAAEAVRAQVDDAVARGARQLIDETLFAASAPGTPYLAPQVLVGVDHSMPIMREETFGPAVGIMKVASDEEAVRLMNDSEFGLTAAIFSADAARAEALGDALQTGTVFLNRCDYLDPAPRLDRRQEFRTRLHVVARRLRAVDTTEVLSLQGDNMSVVLRGNWNYPTTIWAGPGRIAELPAACARAGITRPLVVTDEGLIGAPMIRSALAALKDAALFGAVRGNPASRHVEAGLAAYRAGRHDGVVAFGGGSALDAGKVVAFMSGQTRPLWDFEDVGDWWTRADPGRHRAGRRRADDRRHRFGSRPRGRHPQRGDAPEEDHLPPAHDAAGRHI